MRASLTTSERDAGNTATLGERSSFVVSKTGNSVYNRFMKPALDVGVVLLAAPFWLPVTLLAALFIALAGGQPFYRQERIGRYGKPFMMWKLRTMVPNADAALAAYLEENPAARDEWVTRQKLAKDPRITPVGRFLRRSSLDELPQFFNVLTGDMSLVGPRPMMSDQRDLYVGDAYYSLRPGITGPWQVSERNDVRFDERVRFDDEYSRRISLKHDLELIFKTFGAMAGCRGL